MTSRDDATLELKGRRTLFLAGGAASAGLALATAFGGTANADAAPAQSGAMIDKWLQTKKITIGYEFGTPPMQYLDPTTNQPSGYTVELTKLLAANLGKDITIDYVQVPFGQLFALLASGRCDIIEPVTNLPQRALQGDFVDIPAFYAPVYVVLNPSSNIRTPEELNSSNVRFAVLQGTSQLVVAQRDFPKARFSEFPTAPDAINEVVSGRADASVQSSSSVIQALSAGAPVKLLPSGPLYAESVSYFLRQGDQKTLNWLNNWMAYHAAIGTLKTLYERFVGETAAKYKLQIITVGPAGQAVKVG